MRGLDFQTLTLASAARLIRSKEISPVELIQAVLSRIDRLNPRMAALITVTEREAIAQARAAERAVLRGKGLGALTGIPLSIKDLFDTRGVRTTAGSRVFADRVPAGNAAVVDRLEDAGAVIVGKANLHEFAFGVTSVNPHYGTVRNPWNPDRISGGSSGGSAASVALSMALGSIGSDTGGSVRIPAALCGVVGLKPTFGRVSRYGLFPLSWSLDHVGPLARTVEDAAVMLEVIAGYDPRDPHTRKNAVPSYVRALGQDIQGLRVGVPCSFFFDRLSPQVEAAVRAAVDRLEKLGGRLVEIDLPHAGLQESIFSNIASPEAYSYHEPLLRDRGALYGTDVRGRLEVGRRLLSIDYVRAQRARSLLKDDCKRAFGSADVLVAPAVPVSAPLIEETSIDWPDGTEPMLLALTRCVRLFNIVGLPAMSIPCGFTAEGMPLAFQVVGKAFDEPTVLRVAYAYEQDSGLSRSWPTL